MPLTADTLSELQQALLLDLRRFAPELVLVGTIVLMLLVRLVRFLQPLHLGGVALGGSLAALLTLLGPTLNFWPAIQEPPAAFTGLLALDPLAEYLRGLILFTTILIVILTRLTGIPDTEDAADFYTLLLGATLGMMVMVSAQHLMMVFVAVEMASLPSYALSGFLKGRRTSSEAALKYVIYGAAASGVMLYGISLLVGAAGSGSFAALASEYARALRFGEFNLVLAVGTFFFFVGLAFKLAAVPFHFWLPEVFDGAAAEVAAFLSVASKAAAVGLTARFLLLLQDVTTLGGLDPTLLPRTLGLGLLISAVLTASLGNLIAIVQTDLKRMLAYSTIAHAGYMLMGLATFTRTGVEAVLFYLAAYLLMNLGAFAAVAFVRNRTGSENLDAIRGLLFRAPVLTVGLALCLLSLLGLPPLLGFAGKFQIFAAVYEAGNTYNQLGVPWLGTAFYILLGVGVVNTLISAGYYLKVLRAAGLEDPVAHDEKGEVLPLGEPVAGRLYVALLAAGLIGLGIAWNPLSQVVSRAVGG